MKPRIFFAVGTIALVAVLLIGQSAIGTLLYQPSRIEDQQKTTAIEKNRVIIQEGDTFATIMESFGVPHEESTAILVASKEVYDFTTIRAGKVMHLMFAQQALAAVDYDLTDEKKVVVEKSNNGYKAREEPIVYAIEPSTARATITSSLFADGALVGLEDTTLLALADIFGWDIDFSTDIREDDAFSLVYERRFLDGMEASQGKVLAARFENQGMLYEAYYYKSADGKEGYYDAEGRALSRLFLKSPLNFGYISSGFSYKRTNPVTKQVTPHRAIDYAAPSGTPVIATADGTVVSAGWMGGLGITVEVQHGTYRTQYAHLSKISKEMKKGVAVTQGDVVGYVGSTGISTGPHLQYALFENGNPINPLTGDFPRGDSLPDSEKANFTATKNKLSILLQ